MPIFGAHMSSAGGVAKAIHRATELSCGTVQLFTKNTNQWSARDFTPEEVAEFRQLLADSGLKYATAHDSYLINLASPDDALLAKSIAAFIVELRRAEALGLDYLVMHPGAHVGSGDDAGLARVVASLDAVQKTVGELRVQTLLETTAGQGTTLGHRFEHLAAILAQVKYPTRYGVCVDTCHIFAAGYDLRTPEAYHDTFATLDRVIGRANVKLFHVNDSKKPLGSRVDRHEALGIGCLGIEAFRLLVNDPHFSKLPMILETPKENADGAPMDPVHLQMLHELVVPHVESAKRNLKSKQKNVDG